MVKEREEWVVDTFIELADTLIADFDLIDFLTVLTERCVDLLDAAEVGLVIADQRGRLQPMASSSERVRAIELFEVQNEEGPCLDCYRTGERVLPQSLDERGDERWPLFAPLARAVGFGSVMALPMRLRDDVIGAVNVFTTHDGEVSERDLSLAQALTDAATIGIMQERAVRRAAEVAEQLQGALNRRVTIEQAKGMLAERLTVDVGAAFDLLRSYARNNNLRIADVADAVVRLELSDDVLRSGSRAEPSIRAKRSTA
ncbi:MAG TPA: GAF and ANTAR domain-containing protein [Nitriliruptorales bacterium]